MSPKNVIEVKHLNIVYHDQTVLENISFHIEKGSVAAIIGPNGSGKTTLLRAMLGLIPYQGSITIQSQPVKAALRDIGYVPQRFSFDHTFPITVEEFLRLYMRKKMSPNRFRKSLEEVGMMSQEKKLVGQLSGGQMQRILIARALINNPSILFLDEPVSGVDMGGEKTFYDIIQHLNQKHHITILLVSHEIDVVYKYATQVLCLRKKLLCVGDPHEVLTDKVIQELYGQQATKHQHRVKK